MRSSFCRPTFVDDCLQWSYHVPWLVTQKSQRPDHLRASHHLLSGEGYMLKSLLVPILFLSQSVPSAGPESSLVDKLVAQFKKSQGYAPESIVRYEYQGKKVYLVIAPCCDHYNMLYSDKGEEICAATGGFAGSGDGRCPDFSKSAKKEVEVWTKKK